MLLKAYYLVLSNLSDEEFNMAIANVLSGATFHKLPLPAEILNGIRGNKEDAATFALTELETAMRRVGKYNSIKFTDPLIMATVKAMGGWIKLCCMEVEEWKFQRKDFTKIYQALSSRPIAGIEVPESLAGIIERDNSARGFNPNTQPVLFGKKPADALDYKPTELLQGG